MNNEMIDTYTQQLIEFGINENNDTNIRRRTLTTINALNIEIAEGFFNRIFTGFRLIVRHIINN